MLFVGAYLDCTNDTITPLPEFQDSEDSIKYDLNCIIRNLIYEKYDTVTRDEFLFILYGYKKDSVKNDNLVFTQELKINSDIVLIFIKKENSINIYEKNIKRGYIYNAKNTLQLYKFYFYSVDDNTNSDSVYSSENNITGCSTFAIRTPVSYIDELRERISKLKID